jgi:hypothetical protein
MPWAGVKYRPLFLSQNDQPQSNMNDSCNPSRLLKWQPRRLLVGTTWSPRSHLQDWGFIVQPDAHLKFSVLYVETIFNAVSMPLLQRDRNTLCKTMSYTQMKLKVQQTVQCWTMTAVRGVPELDLDSISEATYNHVFSTAKTPKRHKVSNTGISDNERRWT